MVVLPGVNTSLAVSFSISPTLPYVGTAVFDGPQMRPTVSKRGAGTLIGGPDASTLYGANGGDFFTLALDASGVTVTGEVDGLLVLNGDPVYAGGLIYGGWGTAADPVTQSIVASYDNQGLIVPLEELNKVLIVGSVPPGGWTVPSLPSVLTLSEADTGVRLWAVSVPVQMSGNHGPLIRWGQDGFAMREPQVYNAAAPGVILFRLDLSNLTVSDHKTHGTSGS